MHGSATEGPLRCTLDLDAKSDVTGLPMVPLGLRAEIMLAVAVCSSAAKYVSDHATLKSGCTPQGVAAVDWRASQAADTTWLLPS